MVVNVSGDGTKTKDLAAPMFPSVTRTSDGKSTDVEIQENVQFINSFVPYRKLENLTTVPRPAMYML